MKLRPYQERGVEYILSRRHAALFWEPRTGKTPTAITASLEIADPKKTLVILPASLITQWGSEWREWGGKKQPLFVSYNWIERPEKAAELSKVRWENVIVDEAHALKSWTSARTRHFLKQVDLDDEEYPSIYRKAKRLTILTGTPSTRSAEDYHSLLSMIAPGKFGTLGEWRERHCHKKEIGFGKYAREVWFGYRDTERINRLVKKYTSVKLYEDVVKYLPPTQYSKFRVDVSADMDDWSLDQLMEEEKPKPLVTLLRQLGLDKAEQCIEWLSEFDEPTVIFCWFRETAEYLKANLPDVIGSITGTDSHEKKAAAIKAFRKSKGRSFVVVNIAAGGLGIDLSNSDVAVFVELPYSSADFAQACARLRRPEKTRPIEIIACIAPGSYDERVLEILREKHEGQRKVLATDSELS